MNKVNERPFESTGVDHSLHYVLCVTFSAFFSLCFLANDPRNCSHNGVLFLTLTRIPTCREGEKTAAGPARSEEEGAAAPAG